MKRSEKIVMSVTVVCLGFAGYAWYDSAFGGNEWHRKQRAIKRMMTRMLTSDKPAPPQVDKIDAIRLRAAYESNELTADKQYGGKLLQVNGLVIGVQRDTDGKPYVRLFPSVVCSFDTEERSLLEIAAGDEVSIQGICTGVTKYAGFVTLENSSFIELLQKDH